MTPTMHSLNLFTLEFALMTLFLFSSTTLYFIGASIKVQAFNKISVGLSICALSTLFAIMGRAYVPLSLVFIAVLAGQALIIYAISKFTDRSVKAESIHVKRKRLMVALICLHGFIAVILALMAFKAYSEFGSLSALSADQYMRPLLACLLVFETVRCILLILIGLEGYKNSCTAKFLQLQQLTYTDSLTGAHNKRYASKILQAEKERIKRYRSKCAVAIIDLDHFKNVNDTYGHNYGDHVLTTFTEICRKQLRSFDTLARYGGEEFILILPETDLYQGMLIADRIRKSVQSHVWDKASFSQTICVGVIEVNQENCIEDTHSIIERADTALYVAKKNGRNHVEAAVSK